MCIETVYWLAKEEMPSSKFPSLLALLEMHRNNFSEMQEVMISAEFPPEN